MKYSASRALIIPLSLAVAATSLAQSTTLPATESIVALPTFSVTGSNIKRVDQESTLPVLVLGEDAANARDAFTPIDLLTGIPQVMNVPLAESANASFSARGDFDAINLRGIGSGNTLILLNGRRLAPHPISSTDEGGLPDASVNVNQLPTGGVDRTEVLLDGASSIYGTDAVAGVVNYVMKKRFVGEELVTRVAETKYHDGVEFKSTLTLGREFANSRGRLMSVLDFFHKDAIYLKDRPFSAAGDFTSLAPAPWNAASTLIPLSANNFYKLQSAGAYPSFLVGASATTNYLVPLGGGVVNLTTTAPVRQGVGASYYFNNNAYQSALPRSNRYNIFNQAEFDISNRVTAFGELSYYRATSTFWRQPTSYNGGTFADQRIVIPAGTQWNPFGQSVTLLSKILTDVGPEKDVIIDTVSRMLGGLRGKLGDTWTWETAAYYTEARVNDTAHNAVRESLFDQAVINGSYNPFGFTFTNNAGVIGVGAPYTNSASVISGFTSNWRKDGVSSIGSVDFRASGDVGQLWSGALPLAFGGEFRKEQFKFSQPPYDGQNPVGSGLATDDNDFVLFGPAANWSGGRRVISGYAESVIPLVAPKNGIPLVKSLNITGSFRSENYNDFGSTTKPKIGLDWRPASWLLFRASYNEGFRAPNIPSLNGGQRKSLVVLLDPVTNVSAPHWSILQGNPNLTPEQSMGKSAGMVIDVPKVKGLSITVDYWEITQYNVITTPVVANILANDAALLNPIIAANPGVPLASINLGSGTSSYKGDPRVIRNADNSLYGVATLPFNAARDFTSGTDLSLSYHTQETAVGRFGVSSGWAYLSKYFLYSAPGALRDDRSDRDGAARWHGNTALTWKRKSWSAGVSGYYIGSFQDSNLVLPVTSATLVAQSEALYQSLGAPKYIAKGYNLGSVYYRYVVPSSMAYNSFLSYDFDRGSVVWLKNTSVRLGVDNIGNKAPPVDGQPTGYNPGVYNGLVPGRTYSFQLTRRF